MDLVQKIMILLISFSVIPSALHSAEIDGIYFRDEYSAEGERLKLRGYSILNYMFVIRAYAGALYIRPETQSSQVLDDTPRILELYYFHKITMEDFRESTTEMIKRNTTDPGFRAIKERLGTFNGFYRGVKPGDRYRAEYIPGKGTTLYLNGRSLGTVKGNDFSKAFFSIWIGRSPIDKKFRDRLLGKE